MAATRTLPTISRSRLSTTFSELASFVLRLQGFVLEVINLRYEFQELLQMDAFVRSCVGPVFSNIKFLVWCLRVRSDGL